MFNIVHDLDIEKVSKLSHVKGEIAARSWSHPPFEESNGKQLLTIDAAADNSNVISSFETANVISELNESLAEPLEEYKKSEAYRKIKDNPEKAGYHKKYFGPFTSAPFQPGYSKCFKAFVNSIALTYEVSEAITKQFIGDLVLDTDAKLIAIKSAKGTGKTEWMKKYIWKAIEDRVPVLSLTHRKTLNNDQNQRIGLVTLDQIKDGHAAELTLEQTKSLIEQRQIGTNGNNFVNAALPKECGLVLCVHSLWEGSKANINPDDYIGCIVFMDEVEQVLRELMSSGLMRDKRGKIIKSLKEILKGASRIFILDANLSDWSIKTLYRLMGDEVKLHLIVNDYRLQEDAFPVYRMDDPHILFCAVREAVSVGMRVAYLTTSKDPNENKPGADYSACTMGAELEKVGIKVLVVDSGTQNNPDHPAFRWWEKGQEFFKEFQVIIFTPVIVTGVSLDLRGVFDLVVANLSSSILTPQEICQFLSRVREGVPRLVYLNTRCGRTHKNGGGSIDAKKVLEYTHKHSHETIGDFQSLGIEGQQYVANPETAALQNEVTAAYCSVIARDNAGSRSGWDALRYLLEAEGHTVYSESLAFLDGYDSQPLVNCNKYISGQQSQIKAEEVLSARSYLNDPSGLQELKEKQVKTNDELAAIKRADIERRFGKIDANLLRIVRKHGGAQNVKTTLLIDLFQSSGKHLFKYYEQMTTGALIDDEGLFFEYDIAETSLSPQLNYLERIGCEKFVSYVREQGEISQRDPQFTEFASSIRKNLQNLKELTDTEVKLDSKESRLINAALGLRGLKLLTGPRRGKEKVQSYNLVSAFGGTQDNPYPEERKSIFEFFNKIYANCAANQKLLIKKVRSIEPTSVVESKLAADTSESTKPTKVETIPSIFDSIRDQPCRYTNLEDDPELENDPELVIMPKPAVLTTPPTLAPNVPASPEEKTSIFCSVREVKTQSKPAIKPKAEEIPIPSEPSSPKIKYTIASEQPFLLSIGDKVVQCHDLFGGISYAESIQVVKYVEWNDKGTDWDSTGRFNGEPKFGLAWLRADGTCTEPPFLPVPRSRLTLVEIDEPINDEIRAATAKQVERKESQQKDNEPEPVVESTLEPEVEHAPEPVVEPVVEVLPVPEPVVEVTPEPIVESIPAPEPVVEKPAAQVAKTVDRPLATNRKSGNIFRTAIAFPVLMRYN